MVTRSIGAGTTELHILRPRHGVDARWLCYVVRSKPFLDEGVTAFQGVAGLQRVPSEFVNSFRVADYAPDEQRRIADFLDDMSSRIDRIIAARHEQKEALREAIPSLFLEEMQGWGLTGDPSVEEGWHPEGLPPRWRKATLGRILKQLTNGHVGPTRDILVDDGVRYIQSMHIKEGEIDFQRRPFFVTRDWHQARPRTSLQPGDVLIVQTGAIGNVALVPDDFGDASCHALLIARADRKIIQPRYLTAFLQSSFGKQAMLARATGALHPHLEGGVRSTPIIIPPLEVQSELTSKANGRQVAWRTAIGKLDLSIGLLTEYKSSLITAAVTGDLDVTTAGSNIPG